MDYLTKDQTIALDKLMQLTPGDSFILKGYAGTGKTFLLQKYVEQNYSCNNVIITATTNKAVVVANGYMTIHSYLGLKLKKHKDKQILVQGGNHRVRHNDIIIIDECSMLNSEVLKFILKAQQDFDLTVIYIGDPKQIPPVGEHMAPVFNLPIPSYTLKEIVRQKDNKLLNFVTGVRKGKLPLHLKDNNSIFVGGPKQAKEFFNANFNFKTMEFPQILSFRNNIVDSYNLWARKQNIKSKNLFTENERLYVRSTNENSNLKLETFVKIKKIQTEIEYTAPIILPTITCVKMIIATPESENTLLVPKTSQDINIYNTNLTLLAHAARKREIKWSDFWDYLEGITVLKHRYAMTIHRSQGSTFSDVIVNYPDLQNNMNLFYTACTRAAKRLFIII